MHICHICDSSLQGDYFRNVASGLTRKGVRLSLVELGPGQPPTWLREFPGVSYTSLGASSKMQYPFAVRRLAGFLRDEKVDILHTHLFYSGLIGVLTKSLGSKSVVALMRHHTSVVRMLGSPVHVALDRWMANRAYRMLTVSEAARRYMHEVDGIRRDIDVVHLGFDYETLAPDTAARKAVREELKFGESDFVIGYLANFARGKGHEQLLAAFEKILAEVPNARLVFAGRGELPEVTAAANRLPPGKVVFAGWRSDVAAFLNALDVFVQPSLSEAFSQVIMEAMGVGLPVVATNVGGAGEVIESGRNAVLIEPGDVDALAAAVIDLARDPNRRKRLGIVARETVTAKFGADRMVDRHMELYEQWLGER
jgi:glycosyltransferase involved in cell wall biosynthesis